MMIKSKKAKDDLTLLRGLADHSGIAIANARLFEWVRSGRERMQTLSHKLVEVQEMERQALARERHDQIGQVLTGLQFSLESSKRLNGEALTASLDEAKGLVKNLMAQVRELSLNLRPSLLDDMGLLPTLLWHFDRYYQQTGVKVTFNHYGLDRRFSQEIETTVFRIVQEALTNVARYAGVDKVDVRVSVEDEAIRVQIRDKGTGFDPSIVKDTKRTFGVNGMRERAFLLGGRFEINSVPGEGTQILAVLPLGRQLERRRYARQSGSGR